MADADCTYAVVDKSKKKKNHSQNKSKEKADPNDTMALYSVVERKHNRDPEEMGRSPTNTSIPEAVITTTFTAGDTAKETAVLKDKKVTKFFI